VSFWGPVLGVILYFVARDILGAYTETWLLWFGLMFMAVVMFKPEGLAGIWQDAVAWVRARRRGARGTRAVPAE
jgi:branched-chain amino acid transport system permease protein